MKLTRRVVKTQVTTTTTLSSTFHDLFEHEDVQPLISVTEIDPLKLLDNSDSELVDLLKGHSLPTNQQQHRKLAKTLKLSPKHQQQVKELNKAIFTGYPSDPDTTGRFPEAVDFVKQHWAQIKKCIVENRPIYLIGAVQIGKTIIYNAIVYLAIHGFTRDDGTQEPPLVDLALILTMCSISSGKKNQDESRAYLETHRDSRDILTVVDINDKASIRKGTVVHAIGNDTQLAKVHSKLCQAISVDQEFQKQIKGEFKPWRFLVIHDESDQVNPNLADANTKRPTLTERGLNTVLQAPEYHSYYCAVSATMLSDFAIYDKIGKHRYGDMIPEQIFHLPVDEHYKGFVKKDTGGNPVFNPDFVQTGMISEPKNGTHNPGFIADKMFYHYNDSHTNPYGLPQIATVNLIKLTKGHAAIAKLIAREMNKKCPGSTQVIEEFPADVRSEFVIVTHNSEGKSEIDAKNKILEIYKSAEANGINLKGIVFVGGWKVSRAITFATRDRDHAYCNLSFTAPPKGRIEREAMIQSARCSGRYSDLKTHVFYTTEETKAAIENYYNVFYGDFLPAVGSGSQTVSDWITKFDITYNGQSCTQKLALGKQAKQRHQNISNASKQRATGVLTGVDRTMRDNYINIGMFISNQTRPVLPLDHFFQLTKTEYDQLISYGTDKMKVSAFLKHKGISGVMLDRINNDVKDATLAPGGLTRDEVRNFYYARNGSVTIWQASTGEYVLYYYVGWPMGSSQKGIKYKLELDTQGRVKSLGHAGQRSEIMEPSAQPTLSNAITGTLIM